MIWRLLTVVPLPALALAAFNVLAGFIQRPFLRKAIQLKAGSREAKQMNTALHLLFGGLYALDVAYTVPAWRWGPVLLWSLLAVALRAAIFEPVLNWGLPGRPWGYVGGEALYDRFRRRLAQRLGWPILKMGAWSNIAAAIVGFELLVLLALR